MEKRYSSYEYVESSTYSSRILEYAMSSTRLNTTLIFIFIFPWSADHVNRIGNLPVDLYSAISDDNNNNNCCSVYPQLPPVIGAPWGYYGRGFLFRVDCGSVGVQLT